jgi:sulfur transfer complex TusBCD TusB component (DsrH family)
VESKLEEIERVRHYDDRISDIFLYKEDLLARKLKGNIPARFEAIFKEDNSKREIQRKRQMLYRLNPKLLL